MLTEFLITAIEYLFSGLVVLTIGEKIILHPSSTREDNRKRSVKVVTLTAVAITSTYALEKVVK